MQIVVDGLLTQYQELNSSKKNTLLILPGWSHSSAHWQNTVQELPKDVRVIVLDLPSFGSTVQLPGEPSVKEYADFVVSFIKKLKLKRLTLLGHSFGGQVAVDLTLRYHELVEKLILVSAACVRKTNSSFKSKLSTAIKPISKKLPKSLQPYLIKFMASSDYLKSSEYQRQVLNRILYVDYSGVLRKITKKTFIIWGTEDKTIPNSSKFIAEQINDSVLIPLYGADHNPHIGAVSKLVRAIKRCLDQ